MGGLWVDYNLMSNLPGLFVLGEANFSDHGANRLGASALMQGLADGYFVAPYTVGDYLATEDLGAVSAGDGTFSEVEAEVQGRVEKLLSTSGTETVDALHRELGLTLWEHCGMTRNREGLKKAKETIREVRERFWKDVRVPGASDDLNQSLEKAGRVADFMEFAELMVEDALGREESCGGHFREEHQTEENEAKRDDENFKYVAAWEHKGVGESATLHKEELTFEYCKPTQRSYK